MRWPAIVASLVLATTLPSACTNELPPVGQLVVHLDTDAPLEALALFDRVLVELFPPGASAPCAGCVRELPLDVAKIRAGTFSFGFVPEPRVVGWIARVRMFRSLGRSIPRPGATVETVGYLPAVAEEGVVHLTVLLRTEDVGRPRGTLEAPVLFTKGTPSPSAEGTWTKGLPGDCTREAPKDASCFRGGAFFMGDPRVTVSFGDESGQTERLVVLSPYFLDDHEVTVAELRRAKVARIDSRGRQVDPADGSNLGENGGCTFTKEPGAFEDFPVNCVSWETARAYCLAKGADLPTEAQFEAAATLGGARPFPWGDREPSCSDAVVASAAPDGAPCRTAVAPALPMLERPGVGVLDRVGKVVDLAGNVAEWARDVAAPDASACWSPPLLVDPVCEQGDAAYRTVKGGDHTTAPLPFMATRRARHGASSSGGSAVGFRCATPGR